MSQSSYRQVTGIIFGLIALLHLARIASGWGAVIGGWTVPVLVSWAAVIGGGYLSYQGLKKRG